MKNILLCLNQIGIGGVETAVYNQAIQLLKMNFRVIIIANNGIYRNKLEEKGIIYEEIDFRLENKYDENRIKKIEKILEKYEINQVHIHQFDCINTVVPACINKNISYVMYVHTGILGTYKWFEKTFSGYKYMFKMAFEGAKKIIAITEMAKNENQKRYGISDEKYLIRRNSLSFDNIIKNDIPRKIEKFLIISRLSKEKEISIKNSINVFKEYHKINPNSSLTIIGDGNIRESVENEILDIKDITKMLGAVNNPMEIITQNDVVIGTDRCILEAICNKRISIISGYENLKGIVIPEKMQDLADTNFSANGLENYTVSEIIEQIKKLDEEKIRKIVQKNYEFAYKNLNIAQNIYVYDDNATNDLPNFRFDETFDMIIDLQNNLYNIQESSNCLYKECISLKKLLNEKDKIIMEKNQELNKIYSGKSWKIADKIRKIREKVEKCRKFYKHI